MQSQFNSLRGRFLRCRWYLRAYNITLRNARSERRIQMIIKQLNAWWESFSEAQRQFILAREEW